MSDELIPVEESLSPKLAWLKKNRLTTYQTVNGWRCRNGGFTWIGAGDTEDEAILDYCERHKVKHWTLE